MRDAISMSLDSMKEKGKKDKKVLMVVTDGDDNTSNLSLEELVRKAEQSDVLIYSIGILSEVVLVGWTKKRQSLDRAAGC